MSKIEWTDKTWNPTRGCTKISPGCRFCYAEIFAERWRGISGHAYEQGFDLRLVPEKLSTPAMWSRRRKIFVNSMSDLFHGRIPDDYIDLVFEAMSLMPWHSFQVLTKRASRLAEWVQGKQIPRHIWMGVSVESPDQLQRIDHLRQVDCTRFLSIEPLLSGLGTIDLSGIHWAIVGGETGHRPRFMHADWARSIRDQCATADVPFFFKQWGGKRPGGDRALDGCIHDGFPTIPLELVPLPKERQVLRQLLDGAARTYQGSSRCPVCDCCAMVDGGCHWCGGRGSISDTPIAEANGPCLRCNCTGVVWQCKGGCTPTNHHGVSCLVCGCTEHRACPGGRSSEPGLCSECVQ